MSVMLRGLAVAAVLVWPATHARAEGEVLFPPATPACYVGAEVTPVAAGVAAYAKPAVGVTAVRLERGYLQLVQEDARAPKAGERAIYLRVIVTFADAGKSGAARRFSNGGNDLLICTADICDANNYKVERQADGTVLLRMTGGLYIGGGPHLAGANRHLPDGHVYRLSAKEMSACR